MFVVTRRWSGKEDWARQQTTNSVWKEVRVLDADDLETWLHQHTSIHIWLSLLFNVYVPGVLDLSTWWLDWASQTEPAVQPAWLLAGRPAIGERVADWLNQAEKTLLVVADTATEARSIIAASILLLPDQECEAWLARTVVVTDESIWRQLVLYTKPLVLLPDFTSPQLPQLLAAATRHGHRVLLPRAVVDQKATANESVPPVGRQQLQAELETSGMPRFEAAEKAGLARRSFAAFLRSIAKDRALHTLWWAEPTIAGALAPLVLLSQWDGQQPGDRDLVALLSGRPYAEVERQLTDWKQRDESPFRQQYGEWQVVDATESWEHTANYFPPLRELYAQVIERVLGTPAARFRAPAGRAGSSFFTSERDPYSTALRNGLTSTLALIATTDAEVYDDTFIQARSWAQYQVSSLLERAVTEEAGALLASLDSMLPTLVEAVPDAFLAAMLRELLKPASQLATLFQQSTDFFSSHSRPTGLLWALERLAWTPRYLSDVSLVLAGLASHTPDGGAAHHPLSSLRSIFLGWYPQTNASLTDRFTVLDRIVQREPAVAWRLFMRLMPATSDTSWPTPTPVYQWRNWQINPDVKVLYTEYEAFIEGLTQRLLAAAGTQADRWVAILDRLPLLLDRVREPELRDRVLGQLATLGTARLPDKEQAQLVNRVRDFLNRYRSSSRKERWAEATVAVLDQVYAQLQSTDLLQRHAWLFARWPRLPQGLTPEKQHDQALATIDQAQDAALTELLAAHSIAVLPALLAQVPDPIYLGLALSRSSDLTDEVKHQLLTQYLAHLDPVASKLGLGLAAGLIQQEGPARATSRLREQLGVWSTSQAAAWLQQLPMTPETWQVAHEAGSAVEEQYWQQASDLHYPDEEATYVARRFLQSNRISSAITVLARLVPRQAVPVEVVLDVLEALAKSGTEETVRQQLHGYELSNLLESLEDISSEYRERAVHLTFYFSEYSFSGRNPKLLDQELQQNPGFFVSLLKLLYSPSQYAATAQPLDGLSLEEAEDLVISDPVAIKYTDNAWRILDNWHIVPGMQLTGELNGDALRQWLTEGWQLAAAAQVTDQFNLSVGRLLSYAPAGPENVWPHPVVCELLEQTLDNQLLQDGFYDGRFNQQNEVLDLDTKSEEQEFAQQYSRWAEQLQIAYPSAARVLRRLAETNLRLAREAQWGLAKVRRISGAAD